MTGDPEHDDIQRDLAALLAEVEPSPGFAAGVRARIAADGDARQRAWMSWALPATAVVIVGVLSWSAVSRNDSASGPLPAATARTASTDIRLAAPAAISNAARPQTAPMAKPVSVAAVAKATPEPQVLVPDDQMAALVHYLDRRNGGETADVPGPGALYDTDGFLLRPAPVVIAPLPPLAVFPDDDKSVKPDGRGSGQE
jgi:hypothetical protein